VQLWLLELLLLQRSLFLLLLLAAPAAQFWFPVCCLVCLPVLLLSRLLVLAAIYPKIGVAVLPGVSAAAYGAATVHMQGGLQLAGSQHVRHVRQT
jgi:hypothetical protein